MYWESTYSPSDAAIAALRDKLAAWDAQRHHLTTDWANRPYVVYVDVDGSVVRSAYARNTVIGGVKRRIAIGDTFPV